MTMMKISNIIEYLCHQFDSDEYDQDILQYGLEVLIYNLITILVLLILSLIFHNLNFGFVFIPVFCILRITIGGYHCKKMHTCLLLMVTLYSFILILVKFHKYKILLQLISPILIFSLIFIKPCKENTLRIHQYDLQYKYFLIVLFSICYFIFKSSSIFIPIFSALLLVEFMYMMYFLNLSFKKNNLFSFLCKENVFHAHFLFLYKQTFYNKSIIKTWKKRGGNAL